LVCKYKFSIVDEKGWQLEEVESAIKELSLELITVSDSIDKEFIIKELLFFSLIERDIKIKRGLM
jgi:hypothetical protein